MSDDTLKPEERAALLLLVAVATPEVANPDLAERFDVTITGHGWRGLNERKLVKTEKRGRSLTHEVTDDGWVRARDELTGVLGNTKLSRAAAAAINDQLHRYLTRADLRLFDVFVPVSGVDEDEEGAPTDETVPVERALEDQIRAAYWALAPKPATYIRLADLREALGDAPRKEVDEALLQLVKASDVSFTPESNKKSLTAVDKAAAVRVGRQDNHLIAIERA